jgi:hypothetical protein
MKNRLSFVLPVLVFCSSCSHYTAVDYREVEKTNTVALKQDTGSSIKGTVFKVEPHQIVLLDRNRQTVAVPKSTIVSIRRKKPVLDDFGKGISEDEIGQRKTGKNTTLYGIGGGMLSFGISFFVGSMIGNSANQGASVMASTSACGTVLGTAWFLHAGKNKDRKTAIQLIKTERKSAEITPPDQTQSENVRRMLEDERKKQEDLRKEREELLRQLQQPPGNP